MDFYDCLTGTGLRLRYIGEFKVIGLSIAGAEQGFHGDPSFVQRGFFAALPAMYRDLSSVGIAFTLPIFAHNALISTRFPTHHR
jgi:hypothetical protein